MKTRVLHLTHSLDFGGVESHLRLIAAHGGTNYAHEFAALAGGGRVADRMVASGSRVTILRREPWNHPLMTWLALSQFLRRERFDVVHCHGAEANLWGLWAARLTGVPVRIGEEIGIPNHGWKARLAYRTAYRRAHRVIGVSEAVRRYLVDSREVPEACCVTIFNPVHIVDGDTPKRAISEALQLVFVGRLEPNKNPLSLVEALSLLPGEVRAVEVSFVGDGSLNEEIHRSAEKLGVAHLVKMIGYLDDPASFVRNCDVIVQPSPTEGFGLAVAEALSAGVPALVTGKSAMAELVVDGENGWHLEDVTPAAIAKGLSRVCALSPPEVAALGERARTSVAGRFGIERYINEVESLYEAARGR